MRIILFLLLNTLCLGCLQAQVHQKLLLDSLFIPWGMAYEEGGQLWFTQKNGFVSRLDLHLNKLDTLYHEPEVKLSAEGGMLDLVLHPDFPRTPFLYIAYNYEDGGNLLLKVRRYQYFASTHQLLPSLTLMEGISAGAFHNGCRLAILDEKIYITTGDAGKPHLSQDIHSPNGKTLRIELDGRIPLDNPIPHSPVWSWGHRNAQGMALVDGLILQSEHGPDEDDEINWVLSGGNYGWPEVKGYCDQPSEQVFCQDSNVVEPLQAWTPTLAVGDMVYYHHPMFPQWQGCLLMATLKASKLYALKLNSSHTAIDSIWVIPDLQVGRIRSLEIGPYGQLFLGTSNSHSLGNGLFVDQIWEIYDPLYDTSTSISQVETIRPTIYPNPFQDRLYIQIPSHHGSEEIPFQILGQEGQSVHKDVLHDGEKEIDLRGLPSGIYFLKLNPNGANPGPTRTIEKR